MLPRYTWVEYIREVQASSMRTAQVRLAGVDHLDCGPIKKVEVSRGVGQAGFACAGATTSPAISGIVKNIDNQLASPAYFIDVLHGTDAIELWLVAP